MHTVQIARFIVSFVWIYHGLFPKLVQVAPLEKLITASLGFPPDISAFITKSAGISELFFGIALFIFYQSKPLILLNIFGLILLLIAVAILQPQLLIEAFNPVTTNIPVIGLSLILLKHARGVTDKTS